MIKMKCPHCFKEIKIKDKLGFRETCEFCNGYLHCCLLCKYYKIGYANDCLIPDTEKINDRAHFNFCEDFSPKDQDAPSQHFKNIDEIEERLFGKKNRESPTDRFNSMFKDL